MADEVVTTAVAEPDQAITEAPPPSTEEQQQIIESMTPDQLRDWHSGKTKTSDLLKPKTADSAPAQDKQPDNKPEPGTGESNGVSTRAERRKQELSGEIAQALAERNRLRREAEDLRATIEASKGDKPGTPTGKTDTTQKPKLEDFETLEDYADALTDWKLTDYTRKTEQERTQAEAKAAETKVIRTFQERSERFAVENPDFAEVVGNPLVQAIEGPAGSTVEGFCIQSEHGPEIAYLFAKHPESYRQVMQMTPVDAFKALRDIEVSIELKRASKQSPSGTSPSKQTTKAPLPPPDLPGRSTAPADPIEEAVRSGDTELYTRLKNEAELRKRYPLGR